jgi:hypothetical protein
MQSAGQLDVSVTATIHHPDHSRTGTDLKEIIRDSSLFVLFGPAMSHRVSMLVLLPVFVASFSMVPRKVVQSSRINQPEPRTPIVLPPMDGGEAAFVMLEMSLEEAADALLDESACAAFLERTAHAWERPLALLDVRAALAADELKRADAALPCTGALEIEDLARAADKLLCGELDVRRRYRGRTVRQWLPQWRAMRSRRRVALNICARNPSAELWEGALALQDGDTCTVGPAFHAVAEREDRWVAAALCDAIDGEIRALAAKTQEAKRDTLRAVARDTLAASGVGIDEVRLRLKVAADADEDAVLDELVRHEVKHAALVRLARDALTAVGLAGAAFAWTALLGAPGHDVALASTLDGTMLEVFGV